MRRTDRRPTREPRTPPPVRLELTIEYLDGDGMGVAHAGGREVRVPHALPGERVAAHVDPRRTNPVARLERVLAAAPQRVGSPCRLAGSCSGCPLVVAGYDAQLELKSTRVRQALAAFPHLSGAVLHPIWGAPSPFGYRATVKLAVVQDGRKVVIGMFRAGTREVIEVEGCPVHLPLVNRVLTAVREELERQRPPLGADPRGGGLVRYVTIRVSPALGKAMVTFVTAEREHVRLTHLAKGVMARAPEIVSVQANVNPRDTAIVLGRDTFRLAGAPDLHDRVGALKLAISPTAFFQVNHAQADRIYAQVRAWAALTRADTALDVYCGIGPIALNLAQDAGRVVGVEVVEDAVRNARGNARANGVGNCEFRAGDAVALVREAARRGERPGAVVINPPRAGCDAAVLRALGELAPRTVVYVSCEPATLARDLDVLAGNGFTLTDVQPVDMFPQTVHVESVARLVRSAAPPAAR